MKDFYLDQNANFVKDEVSRSLQMTPSEDIWLAQKLRAKLSIIRGEWFADQSVGLPLLGDVTKNLTSQRVLESLVVQKIRGTEHVNGIVQFSVSWDRKARVFMIQFTVDTDFGELSMEV